MTPITLGAPGGTAERPALFFADAGQWRAWLAANHASANELWMGLAKKHVEPRGLTWADAVREALCWGWIDGRVEGLGADAVRQRWTPRRPGSTWSTVNVAAAEELIATGRMQPAGRAAYDRRRADRTGIYSFEQGDLSLPPAYAARLAADPRARRLWEGATAGYRKIATHWVMSAKREATRDQRLTQLVADCAAGRLIPSQRYGKEPVWVGRLRADREEPS